MIHLLPNTTSFHEDIRLVLTHIPSMLRVLARDVYIHLRQTYRTSKQVMKGSSMLPMPQADVGVPVLVRSRVVSHEGVY